MDGENGQGGFSQTDARKRTTGRQTNVGRQKTGRQTETDRQTDKLTNRQTKRTN